jgi:protein-tyrosine kinase
VKQLGKIFDALAKSKKEQIKPSSTSEENTMLTNQHQKIVKPSDIAGTFSGNNIDRNLVALINSNSFESEQFKLLRTALLFPVSGKPPGTIMITSAVPGEGKSFVAANLAVSIAQGINEHVLLMDCDMRMPSLHRSFGFGNVQGLSDYLANGASLSSSLLKTKVEKLTILPGGKPQHNPAELLSSVKMSQLLAEVKTRYPDRYIIIDLPPPQLTAETVAIARQVDGIIFVIKCGSTRHKLVEDTLKKLDKKKILGVIINRFDIQSMKYGYGRYGKYSKYYAQ